MSLMKTVLYSIINHSKSLIATIYNHRLSIYPPFPCQNMLLFLSFFSRRSPLPSFLESFIPLNRGMMGRVGENRRVEYGGGQIEEIMDISNNLKGAENLELLN